MSRIVAIGEETLLEGYALAGVSVTAAPDAGSVLEAWSALEPGDAELVILTRAARDALGAALSAESGIGWVVLPE